MNQFLSNKIIAGIVALALLVGVGVLISSGDTSSTTRNAALVVATPCTKPGQVTKVSKQSVVCAKTNTGSLWYATMKAKGKAQACKPPGEIRKKSKIVWVCGVVRKKKLWQATQPLPPAVVASTTFIEPGATQPTPELDSTQVATPLVPVVADNLVLVDTKILDDKIITQAIGASPPVPGLVRYIVLFRPGKTSDTAADVVTSAHGGTEIRTFENVLNGAVIDITARDRAALMNDPNVLSVEQDAVVTVTQTDAPWGLDRLDQRALPLSTTYSAPTEAINVRAFIIDTGINKKHVDFGSRVVSGFDAIDSGGDGSNDCNGHGTHVAGTVGGTTYGVAKGITLVPVRALGCTGSGTLSGVIAGLDWVVSQHQPGQLDVANMSLGAGASSALDTAVNNAITRGVSVVVAAGNSNADACNSSPARVPAAITVAASDRSDIRASFSNYGSCVDVFAPGVAITSTWWGSTTATNTISGTSMASPHVAGLAALTLQLNGVLTPAQLASVITANATTGIISSAGTNTPNRLVFIDSNPLTPPTTTPPPSTTIPKTYQLGETGPGGGIVFYVAQTTQSWGRYLEAAPTDYQVNGSRAGVKWGCYDGDAPSGIPDDYKTRYTTTTTIPRNPAFATGEKIGTGKANTGKILAICTSPGIAADVANKYSTSTAGAGQWFLPSKDELNELCKYARKTSQAGGPSTVCGGGSLHTGFAEGNYWSSSEGSATNAWDQNFTYGYQYDRLKNYNFYVRPVRAF